MEWKTLSHTKLDIYILRRYLLNILLPQFLLNGNN